MFLNFYIHHTFKIGRQSLEFMRSFTLYYILMREINISLEDIRRGYYEEKLKRLEMGYPLKFRRTRPRDPFKSKAMVEWLLRITPPAKDILSGEAFDRLFRERGK